MYCSVQCGVCSAVSGDFLELVWKFTFMMSILAKEQMVALVGFSVKVTLSCGHKRSGESFWFKGKEDYHFN